MASNPLTRLLLRLLYIAVIIAIPTRDLAQAKQRVVVYPFADNATAKIDPSIGAKLTDELVSHLSLNGGYTVVDTQSFDRLLAEKNLKYDSDFDATNPTTLASLGGVDVVVIGKIEEFHADTQLSEKNNSLYRTITKTGSVKLVVSAKIISVADRRVFFESSADSTQSGLLSTVRVYHDQTQHLSSADSDDGKAADQALNKLVDLATEDAVKKLAPKIIKLSPPPYSASSGIPILPLPPSTRAPAQPIRPAPVVPSEDPSAPAPGPSPSPAQPTKPLPVAPSELPPAPPPSPSPNQPTTQLAGRENKPIKDPAPSKPNGTVDPTDDIDEANEQQAYERVMKNANDGSIQYNVPPTMAVGKQVSVIVDIYGATASAELKKQFQATGSGALKVITPMMVVLSAPENPDAFKIEPDPVKSGSQFLPTDGRTEWVWKVTPLKGAKEPEKLTIDAYMVMNAKLPNGQSMTKIVKSYTVPVPVQVEPLPTAFLEFLQKNWDKLLGYLVPSGAGVALIAWLASRKKAKAGTT